MQDGVSVELTQRERELIISGLKMVLDNTLEKRSLAIDMYETPSYFGSRAFTRELVNIAENAYNEVVDLMNKIEWVKEKRK